jgi:PEP-CTERM motif
MRLFSVIFVAATLFSATPAAAQHPTPIVRSLIFEAPKGLSRPAIRGFGYYNSDSVGLGVGFGSCYLVGGEKCDWGFALLPSGNTTVEVQTRTASPTKYSFEFNNLFGGSGEAIDGSGAKVLAISYVPEPATWAMMILGFGFTGAKLRHRRRFSFQTRSRSVRS